MLKLKGLATGIGSLPYKDAEMALDLIFRHTPYIPFWPQLPKRDIREGMLAQFSENLPCLKVTDGGLFFTNSGDKENELEIFYEHIIAQDLDYFKISEDFALGLHRFYRRLEKSDLRNMQFIKCQVVGPFTFAASLKDEFGIASLYDAVFMQAILRGLIMKALWQIDFLKKFGKKIILFFDEPYLSCFGSAYASITRESVVKGLTEFVTGIKSQDVLIGVHCCGNTDWSIFTEIEKIDIINFDAFGFLDRFVLYPDNLKHFLYKGGIICWGIVPTQEPQIQEGTEFLLEKIKGGIEALIRKGIDRDLLLDNMLLSPSCGLGTLDIKRTEKVFSFLSELSSLLREEKKNKLFDKLT